MRYCVYLFKDAEDQIIYVGKTRDIKKRMMRHFSMGHLPACCYDSVERIFFAYVGSPYNAEIFETYLIGKYHPKYNADKKFRAESEDAELGFLQLEWKELFFERTESGVRFHKLRFPYMEHGLLATEQAQIAIETNLNIIRYHPCELWESKTLMRIPNIWDKLESLYVYASQHISKTDCDFSENIVPEYEEHDDREEHVIAFYVEMTSAPECFTELLGIGWIFHIHDNVFGLPMICSRVLKKLDNKQEIN